MNVLQLPADVRHGLRQHDRGGPQAAAVRGTGAASEADRKGQGKVAAVRGGTHGTGV